jgi:PAS domain S-box-containing protein
VNDPAKTGDRYTEEVATLHQRINSLEASEANARATSEILQSTLEELQVAEEELRQQNEELTLTHPEAEQERSRYALLFDLVPGGYVVTDAAGIIREINGTAAILLNRAQTALLGKPLLLFVARADQQTFHTQLSHLKFRPRVQDWEIQLQPWQGKPFPAGINIAVMQEPGQQECRLYWLIQDLTARKQAEAERQHFEREAKRSEHFALLGKLAAGLSHEIRNPLGAISLNVDVLAEELAQPMPDSTAHVAQSLAEIKVSLARLDDLLQDYLSLVRVSTLSLQPIDLGTVMTMFVQEMAAKLAGRAISLQLDGLATLGTVMLHQNAFRRVLVNLVQNAMDAMPQGGVLALCGQRYATHVQLKIRDSGSGVAADSIPQIFEPLYTTKPGGTGLGLYIVQEIVAAHSGQVTVQSQEGNGTTFTITLPVKS